MIHGKAEAVVQRVGALVAPLTAVLCLAANPVHASITADFDGDGVPDAVVLPLPPETNIVIQLSDSAPQVLKLSGRIISVVAADVDHDGNLDLGALSDRHLRVWLNKTGHGRFSALKKHRAPRGFGFSPRARTSATQHGDNTPDASNDQSGLPDADVQRAGPAFEIPAGGRTIPTRFSASPEDPGKSTAPRGPPS